MASAHHSAAAAAAAFLFHSFQQSGGTVTLEFERPIAASGDAANEGTREMPLDRPVTLIMARGPGNGFSDFSTDYHG
jgi:hypothetical protein